MLCWLVGNGSSSLGKLAVLNIRVICISVRSMIPFGIATVLFLAVHCEFHLSFNLSVASACKCGWG